MNCAFPSFQQIDTVDLEHPSLLMGSFASVLRRSRSRETTNWFSTLCVGSLIILYRKQFFSVEKKWCNDDRAGNVLLKVQVSSRRFWRKNILSLSLCISATFTFIHKAWAERIGRLKPHKKKKKLEKNTLLYLAEYILSSTDAPRWTPTGLMFC